MGTKTKQDRLSDLTRQLHEAASDGNAAEAVRLEALIHRERLRRSLGSKCWVIAGTGGDRDDLAEGVLVRVGPKTATVWIRGTRRRVPQSMLRFASADEPD